jgi:hypothetical protein
MKKIIFAVLAVCSVGAGYGQSGDNNAQIRKVSAFQGVEVSGGIDLYLTSGPESVSVSASSETVRDHIITEVVHGTLRIHLEENWSRGIRGSNMKAYVSLPALKNLGASGGSDVFLQNEITGTDIDIDLSGGSDLKGKLSCTNLEIKQSGGSDVSLSGNVQKLKVEASGGSDLEGYGLVTDYANLSSSGGSDSKLTVNKELYIVASGASDVSYKGAATVKQVNTSGSSSVTHKD